MAVANLFPIQVTSQPQHNVFQVVESTRCDCGEFEKVGHHICHHSFATFSSFNILIIADLIRLFRIIIYAKCSKSSETHQLVELILKLQL